MFMSQRRGTLTDQLTNVIQVIQLGRKSGLLTVERGEGSKVERGEITFVRGQITQAQVGNIGGQLAFNWLSTWGACRFTFTPASASSSTTQPLYAREIQSSDTNPRFRIPPTTQLTPAIPTAQRAGSSLSIPQRKAPGDQALRILERAGLSRLHRHLFLLVDGRRTTTELVRLMGKNYEDVYRLLLDLEQIGIIQK